MPGRLLFKFVEYYLPILVLSNLAVLFIYEKGPDNSISLQQQTLPVTRQFTIEPMMDIHYYSEHYPIIESDFYPQKIAYLDNVIVGSVIGMDSDYLFRTIDLSGKGTTHKRLFDNYE